MIKLSEYQIFNDRIINIELIAQKIKKIKYNPNDEITLDFDKDFGLFFMTDGAKTRLLKIKEALNYCIPVLLEGPAGSSKTRSVQILSDLMKEELNIFNLSSETTTEDFFGRLVSKEKSSGCFSFQEGPFIDAFANGKWLLLNEIKFVPKTILQCMEAALDSHYIIVEIPGRGIIRYQRNPNFRLITTQNLFIVTFQNRGQSVATEFLSRSIPIEFPEIKKDELLEIARKLAEHIDFKNDAFIKDLVDFHYEWNHLEEERNSSQIFTIRDIQATILTIQKHRNPFDTIMTLYGCRFPEDKREELIRFIQEKYPNLNSDKTDV